LRRGCGAIGNRSKATDAMFEQTCSGKETQE